MDTDLHNKFLDPTSFANIVTGEDWDVIENRPRGIIVYNRPTDRYFYIRWMQSFPYTQDASSDPYCKEVLMKTETYWVDADQGERLF